MAKKSIIFDSTIESAENYMIWGFINLTILAVLRPNSIVEKSRISRRSADFADFPSPFECALLMTCRLQFVTCLLMARVHVLY